MFILKITDLSRQKLQKLFAGHLLWAFNEASTEEDLNELRTKLMFLVSDMYFFTFCPPPPLNFSLDRSDDKSSRLIVLQESVPTKSG